VSTAAEDRLSFPGGAIRTPSFASQRLQNDRDLSITQALSLVQRLLLVVHTGLSKKQRLTELCRKIDARGGCGGFVLEGWLVMTKLSRAVIACISATTISAGAASIAVADTFTYA
jgi:hypothetical protein